MQSPRQSSLRVQAPPDANSPMNRHPPSQSPQLRRKPVSQIRELTRTDGKPSHHQDIEPLSSISRSSVEQETKSLAFLSENAHLSWIRKLGKLSMVILILGTIIILAALSFTAFLWFSNDSNHSWHSVIVSNRLTLTVTILGEALKQAVNFQIGIAGALLAAIALERGEVFLRHAASLTSIRAGIGAGNLLVFSWMQLKVARFMKGRNFLVVTFALLETLVLAFSQVITILLASDIGLRPMAGNAVTSVTRYGFTFGSGPRMTLTRSDGRSIVSPWSKSAGFYPTFAEYSEPPFVADGVSDTGLTLRAFLPFSTAETRQDTHTYNGNTTVLDARVTCQIPYLERDKLIETDAGDPLGVTGAIRASRYTPRLGNTTISMGENEDGRGCPVTYNESIGFFCAVPTRPSGSGNPDTQWRMTMCQLSESSNSRPFAAGGLISEFKENLDLPDKATLQNCTGYSDLSSAYGTAYLVLNLTKGQQDAWSQKTESGGRAPEFFQTHGKWLDLILGDGELVVSMTLCYSSFDNADVPVTVKSTQNRTESSPSYNFTTSKFDWRALRTQYGQYKTVQDLSGRNLLSLEKSPSWLSRSTKQEPYLRDYANLNGPTGSGNVGNFTAVLWDADTSLMASQSLTSSDYQWLMPDETHISLFQDIVQSGGSIAFALQSLITVLSGMTYYDHMNQFNASATASRSAFVSTNTPVRHGGLIAVIVVLLFHLLLVFVILALFLQMTKFSSLNNAWPALAQAKTALIDQYTENASMKIDSQIEKEMGQNHRNTLIRVGRLDSSAEVGMIRKVI